MNCAAGNNKANNFTDSSPEDWHPYVFETLSDAENPYLINHWPAQEYPRIGFRHQDIDRT